MATEIKDPNIIHISGRLSYPALFKMKEFKKGDGKPSYSATCIMDKVKDAASIAKIRACIDALTKEEFNGKALPEDRVCLHDGAKKTDDSEEGHPDGYGPSVMYIAARNDKVRPGVVARDLSPLAEEDGKPYAGCYVNMTVRLWAQGGKSFKSEWGKRINCTLRNVQFVKDGPPFGEKITPADREFAALPADESPVDDQI